MNTFSSVDNYNVVLTDRRCPGVTEHIVDNNWRPVICSLIDLKWDQIPA